MTNEMQDIANRFAEYCHKIGPNAEPSQFDIYSAGYDFGFAMGSGDEGAYQRKIQRLRGALESAAHYITAQMEGTPQAHVMHQLLKTALIESALEPEKQS